MKKKMIRPEIKVITMPAMNILAGSDEPSPTNAKSLINGLNRGGAIEMNSWSLQ